eukprot:gene4353-4774_t
MSLLCSHLFCLLLIVLSTNGALGWSFTNPSTSSWVTKAKKAFLVGLGGAVVVAGTAIDPALANREIANLPTSGIFFKDSLRINAFEDPKVDGVTLYLSDFDRPLTEKLSKDFFNDPSSSSITCAKTGPIVLRKDVDLSSAGEEVFQESRNLFFKQIRVRRVVDKEKKALVYVSYSTRFDKSDDSNKGRFRSSLCALPID